MNSLRQLDVPKPDKLSQAGLLSTIPSTSNSQDFPRGLQIDIQNSGTCIRTPSFQSASSFAPDNSTSAPVLSTPSVISRPASGFLPQINSHNISSPKQATTVTSASPYLLHHNIINHPNFKIDYWNLKDHAIMIKAD